jgi:hypothetical protein
MANVWKFIHVAFGSKTDYLIQDNPPLRSGIPERKMKGAANLTLDM